MSKYQLITDLCESRVFRSRAALDRFDTRKKANLLYGSLLAVIAGSNDSKTSGWAKDYAGQTAAFNNFDFFRPSATDLYVLLYDAQMNGTLGSQRGKIIRLLKSISLGTTSESQVQSTALRLERSLPSLDSRLKIARRNIVAMGGTTPTARKEAAENLVNVIKSIASNSEVLPYMKILISGPHGHFGKTSTLKKAAALAGAGLAGFALGWKAYNPHKKFWEGAEFSGKMLTEDRATQLAYIVQKLPEHPAVEKVISVHYLADGITALVRTTDGNAYEFEIRPAKYAKGHQEKTGVTEEWEYRVEEADVVNLDDYRAQKEADIQQWRKDNPPVCPKCQGQLEGLKKYKPEDPDWLCMRCMLPIEDARTPK